MGSFDRAIFNDAYVRDTYQKITDSVLRDTHTHTMKIKSNTARYRWRPGHYFRIAKAKIKTTLPVRITIQREGHRFETFTLKAGDTFNWDGYGHNCDEIVVHVIKKRKKKLPKLVNSMVKKIGIPVNGEVWWEFKGLAEQTETAVFGDLGD